MSIDTINLWHRRARPEPTDADFRVQLGCHFEEIAEMIATLELTNEYGPTPGADTNVYLAVSLLADALKSGAASVQVADREGFLDSICDQVVTGVGAAHCADMRIVPALDEVSRSNWSKTVNGEFQRDSNGKIKKPDTYSPPDLRGFY